MAGETSRENGKKGGRPKGCKSNHTLEAIEFRKYLIERVKKEKKEILDAMMKKAKEGDARIIKEIFDRFFGRPEQAIDLTSRGKELGVGKALPSVDLSKMSVEELKKLLAQRSQDR